MSLWIKPERVTAVLLADGWHEVQDFYIDAYEYVEGDRTLYSGEDTTSTGLTSAGFAFYEAGGDRVSGPISSVLAVREEVAR